MKKSSCFLAVLFLMLIWANPLQAQLQRDNQYGCEINVPKNWSKKTYLDGTDRVYDFYSADENAAVQLRAFDASGGVTMDLLVQVYESGMLPAGTQRVSLGDKVSTNGIPGKEGIYHSTYNGIPITYAVFYVVQRGKGYVLTAILPDSMVESKGPELRSVTTSFKIDGFSGAKQTTVASSAQASAGSGKISAGRYNFVSRSDGKVLTNYHYILIESDGNFLEVYNPKNSGNYESKVDAIWKVQGDKLIVKHKNGNITDVYTIRGNELIYDSGGTQFLFRRQ